MFGYEYSHPYYALFGLLGLIAWFISFFYFFKKPQIFIPKKFRIKSFPFLRIATFACGVVAWCFISFSLMGPRVPAGFSQNPIEVNDVFIVLDLSRSMLAEDLKPNRFEAAKQKIQDFVNLFPVDRIGVIVFAEKVFTLLPLSTDLNLIKRLVSGIQMGALGDGTNIGDALSLGVGRLLQSQAKTKVLILLTDGVSNVGVVTPLQAAEMAKENKIKIYTIGIGGDADARLPLGRNAFGTVQYQRIPGGSVDEPTLRQIATMTGGKFFMAKNNNGLANILEEINKLEKTQIEQSGKIVYKELFFNYLLIGVILLFASEISRRMILREGV